MRTRIGKPASSRSCASSRAAIVNSADSARRQFLAQQLADQARQAQFLVVDERLGHALHAQREPLAHGPIAGRAHQRSAAQADSRRAAATRANP